MQRGKMKPEKSKQQENILQRTTGENP